MFAALCLQTLVVTLFRRLRIAVLQQSTLLVTISAYPSQFFDMALQALAYMPHTNNGSHAAAPAARRYSSLQVLGEGWTAKQVRAERAVQGGLHLSKVHSHPSLMHTQSPFRAGLRCNPRRPAPLDAVGPCGRDRLPGRHI